MIAVFQTSLGLTAFKIVMIISTVGQFFCAGSGMTSASRMTYAFSRDRAIPGWKLWSKVTASKAPRNATMFIAFWCAVVAIPALKGNAANTPIAFFALTAITVIGLYLAYLIPIFLRWRMGDSFVAGPWTLGNKYKWMAPIAMLEVHRRLHLLLPAVRACRAFPATWTSRGTTATSSTPPSSSAR